MVRNRELPGVHCQKRQPHAPNLVGTVAYVLYVNDNLASDPIK